MLNREMTWNQVLTPPTPHFYPDSATPRDVVAGGYNLNGEFGYCGYVEPRRQQTLTFVSLRHLADASI